jgi:transposase
MAEYGLKEGAFVYIGDSAMVTETNLKVMGDDIRFISRLPATYNECDRVISEAVEKDEWEDLGVLAETGATVKRPSAVYKAFESKIVLYGKTYRAIVVHSSSHDKRRQKRIERELETERNAINSQNMAIVKKEFFCRADAQSAVDELRSTKSKYYRTDGQVKESPRYKRGRPKGGVREVQEIRYGITAHLTENTEAVERLRKEAGCFVLISNVPKEGEGCYDSHSILKAYKDQYGIEQNFGFLKNPAIVNGIFLKKAERIEVLGLVLLLSLLIWRLIEYTMRRHIDRTSGDLPGWKKRRTERPTSFMLVTKFSGIMIIKIGEERKLNRPLTSQQKEYLVALGIREDVFIRPGCG